METILQESGGSSICYKQTGKIWNAEAAIYVSICREEVILQGVWRGGICEHSRQKRVL
jgi:hypothetical protein